MSPIGSVLVVDDEAPIRNLISRRLTTLGWRVMEASSGTEALTLIDAGEHIDLLITDINMPGMSGIVLVAQVHARRPQTKILYISGFTERLFAGGEWLRPGELYLEKPFTPAGFMDALQRLGFPSAAIG